MAVFAEEVQAKFDGGCGVAGLVGWLFEFQDAEIDQCRLWRMCMCM